MLTRLALAAAVCGVGQGLSESVAHAQQWQPTRNFDAQPVNEVNALRQNQAESVNGSRKVDHAPRPVLSSAEQVGSGVVLRWQTTAPRGASTATAVQANSKIVIPTASPVQFASHPGPSNQPGSTSPDFDNPLRQSISNNVDHQIRPAAYQQDWTGSGANTSPQWRSVNTRRVQEEAGSANQLPDFPGNLDQAVPAEPLGQPDAPFAPRQISPFDGQKLQDPSLDLSSPPADPLDRAEAAPAPPVASTVNDPPAFPSQIKEDASAADKTKEQIDPPAPLNKDNEDDSLAEIVRRARMGTPGCISQRDMLRGKPLSTISLDVSPKLSEGLSSMKSDKDDEKVRKEFEQKSMLRDWTDYKGDLLASGRLVDLRLGNIVLDVGGSERMIPLSSLSDVDMSYIADLWNLPFRCGTGFEPLEGRNFIASTVQWKASGACHNPLYFEQVQLERYGHEVGPVLQPLISSAHFFLTIPMLPYKKGINPPCECQYALGYYRPGNCAPYMIQPFPWSLRGGLVQAAEIVGGVALIP